MTGHTWQALREKIGAALSPMCQGSVNRQSELSGRDWARRLGRRHAEKGVRCRWTSRGLALREPQGPHNEANMIDRTGTVYAKGEQAIQASLRRGCCAG